MHYTYIFLLFFCFCLFATSALAQNTKKDVPVIVIDGETNDPLIGVNVLVNGKLVAITDERGRAVLEQVGYFDKVVFSFTGYEKVETLVTGIYSMKTRIVLYPESTLLEAVQIIGRRNDPVKQVPNVAVLTGREDIALLNAQTTADALEMDGQVFLQKSQMGGGSPVIRGFEANKLLLVVDDVRMNNAIYRNGHLQNAITIDPSMLEQIEVIYGPGSLMYGSDALGGVIHFRTQDPKLLKRKQDSTNHQLETRAMTRFSSANLEKSLHADFNYGTTTFGFFSSLSFSDYGDLRSGNNRPDRYPDFGKREQYVLTQDGIDFLQYNADPNVQIGTGYNQIDLLQKFRFRPNNYWDFVGNFQYSTSSDVPRYDNLITPKGDGLKFAEWYYGPQKRLLASLKVRKLSTTHPLYHRAVFIAGYQKVDEDRVNRKFDKSNRVFNLEDVKVWSFTGDFDKNLDANERHLLSYGFEANHNTVISEAGSVDIPSGQIIHDEATRYPSGGSSMTSAGAYVNYRWQDSLERFSANAGLRYSYVRLKAAFSNSDPIAWPESFLGGVGNVSTALTWAVGGRYQSKDNFQVQATIATAFRSPNIDDFGKVRPKGDNVTVPNIGLQPENALTGEITIGKIFGQDARKAENSNWGRTHLHISGTAFYTLLTDAIVRVNSNLGSDTLLPMGEELFRIQKNINATEAYIYGTSLNVSLQLLEHWQFKSGINFTKGRERIDGEEQPLAHIPPTYGQTSITYRHPAKTRKEIPKSVLFGRARKIYYHPTFTIKAMVQYNTKKPLEEFDLGNSDNEEYATPEGALGWVTYNIYTSLHFDSNISINFAVENITDIHYRPFSSGVSAAGRNLVISLTGRF